MSQSKPSQPPTSNQFLIITRLKLRWQWKFTIFNGTYIYKCWNFHCYVSLPGCTLAEANSKLATKNGPNLATKNQKPKEGGFPLASFFRGFLLLVCFREAYTKLLHLFWRLFRVLFCCLGGLHHSSRYGLDFEERHLAWFSSVRSSVQLAIENSSRPKTRVFGLTPTM